MPSGLVVTFCNVLVWLIFVVNQNKHKDQVFHWKWRKLRTISSLPLECHLRKSCVGITGTSTALSSALRKSRVKLSEGMWRTGLVRRRACLSTAVCPLPPHHTFIASGGCL